jgi:predicted HTH domain antitoxin
MSTFINLEVSQDILDAARLTPQELKVELAVSLYGQNRLSLGKARELAGLSLWEFRQLLATRHMPPHYEASDLNDDLNTLDRLRQP